MAEYIYRTIDLRIWGDEKVRRLSRPPPNGRDLFLYLLTAKESISIPGVIPAGPAAMAETLRWQPEGFREAFAEVQREGLVRADLEAPLVWVPNAIRYNPPQSPNVVRSWGRAFLGVPDSPLKAEILQAVKAFLEAFGEGYRKAYREAFEEALRQPWRNQEQEQEQEQNQDQEQVLPDVVREPVLTPTPPPKGKKERKPSTFEREYQWAMAERAKQTQEADRAPRQLNAQLKPVVEKMGVPGFRAAWAAYLGDNGYPAEKCTPPWPFALFLSQSERYAALARRSAAGPQGTKPLGDEDPYSSKAAGRG